MTSIIKQGDTFNNLTAQWIFIKKKGNVWKCTCKCGGYCYVKEKALVEGIVSDCGKCAERSRKELNISKNDYMGPMWLNTLDV